MSAGYSTGHRFEAVWPILDVDDLRHPAALLDEAADDLPRVARQARAELTGPARFAIRRGREVPGSGGAAWVVHAIAPASPIPARAYRLPTYRAASVLGAAS